jgi:tetratricopeptide (TPR) repeat protein
MSVAGNREVFEQAMRQGTNYAWDRQWNKAIAEYQRALSEFSDEAPVYAALGQALVYAGRVQEALQVYQRAARLTPEDPSALSRVAELQEQTGNIQGAIRTWLHTADLHLRQRAVDAAVKVWQHVVELAPDTLAARERLAKAYAGMDQMRKAVREYLHLAAIYQQQGDDEQATAACQRALELDPRDPDVLTAQEAIQQGRSLSELIEDRSVSFSYTTFETGTESDNGAASPVELTRQKALEELAGALLEDSSIGGMDLTAALLQGIDYQTRGEVEAAIDSYERAVAGGINHVAAYFNLGLLYQEKLQFEEAIQRFQRVVDDPDYALGAFFALGECWRALGNLEKATAYFIDVLEQLDLSFVNPERRDELRQTYDALAHRYATIETQGTVAEFINSLVEFLGDEYWESRLTKTRRQLNRLGGERVVSMAEVLALPDSGRVLDSMVRTQEYFEQGMIHSASEECLWAIERVPDYLPLHLQLARLFMKGNQIGMAIGKYLYVADTFAARGEMDQARVLYEQVLRMAPMDLDVRQKLIGLLLDHRMIEQALEHQLALADAYYELAQIESSRERYDEALHLASQLPDSRSWTARILHRLGDIDLQRLDWRSAITSYQRLKESVPEDDKARQRLIELYFNLERRNAVVSELDELMELYRGQGNLAKGLEVLEEMLETRPEELELHKRAAQLNVETGNKEGAISHLDAMGELQLQSGYVQEAAATIKAIIALGPENVEAYRQLLEQIA